MSVAEKEVEASAEGADKKKSFGGRRRACRFCGEDGNKIDYKDPSTLKFFITDRGKLVPRRLTGNCAKHQRSVAVAIKRSRMIALIPFSVGGI